MRERMVVRFFDIKMLLLLEAMKKIMFEYLTILQHQNGMTYAAQN